MKKTFFTVGPSKLYSTVPAHIRRALEDDILSLSHRSQAFQEIFKNTVASLKTFCNIPDGHHVFFLTSGSEGMERVIQNCVSEESFHFVQGAFGEKFHRTAVGLKKKTALQSAKNKNDFDTPVPQTAEAVCFTQNETSTGYQAPPEVIASAAKRYPEKLVFVDVVSSLPYVDLDYRAIDCAFFSIQKGFGLPAGLGVIVVSPRALERALALEKKGLNVSWYHSFGQLLKYAERNQTNETPNIMAIYLLGKIIEDMKAVGLAAIRKATDDRARRLYRFFEENSDRFSLPVVDPVLRSRTTLVAGVTGGSAPLITKLKEQGLVVGAGYGTEKENQIRVANFPAHTDDDFERLSVALQN